MSTADTTSDQQLQADLEAVMQHVANGTPVKPQLARRVRDRSQKLMEETRRRCGEIDVIALLRSVRDE